jgi:hypothetical protein
MTKSCHEKCIGPKYYEEELNKGESVCVDRCVAKYLEVNVKVGEVSSVFLIVLSLNLNSLWQK